MAHRGMNFGMFLAPCHWIGEHHSARWEPIAADEIMIAAAERTHANEGANREETLNSYELFARYVMPRFQGSLGSVAGSYEWARDNRKTIFGPNVEAIRSAYTDAKEYLARTSGGADAGPTAPGVE